MGAAPSTRHLVYKLLIHLLLLAALIIDAALGQGAQMVGGGPPKEVEMVRTPDALSQSSTRPHGSFFGRRCAKSA